MWGFSLENGRVVLDGRPLSDIAAEVGVTPFYLYSKRLIQERVEALRAHLPDSLKLHYAVKANPLPEVIQYVSGLVDGLDVASGGELEMAYRQAPKAVISFAGPGKSDDELAQSLERGACINLESLGEARRLAAIRRRRETDRDGRRCDSVRRRPRSATHPAESEFRR